MATVLLARHGESTWNRQGRIQGWAPTPLTERGRAQARTLADHVAAEYDLDALYASDLRRTLETVRPVARETDLDATPDRAWRERDFGCLQGLAYDDLFDGYPEFGLGIGHTAAEVTPESGESLLDARERVLDAWDDLRASLAPDDTVMVVTHGGPLYLVLGEVKGIDVVASVMEQEQGNCALNEIRLAGEEATLARENDVSFLAGDESR